MSIFTEVLKPKKEKLHNIIVQFSLSTLYVLRPSLRQLRYLWETIFSTWCRTYSWILLGISFCCPLNTLKSAIDEYIRMWKQFALIVWIYPMSGYLKAFLMVISGGYFSKWAYHFLTINMNRKSSVFLKVCERKGIEKLGDFIDTHVRNIWGILMIHTYEVMPLKGLLFVFRLVVCQMAWLGSRDRLLTILFWMFCDPRVQRVFIKFCCKFNKTVMKTYQLVVQMFGEKLCSNEGLLSSWNVLKRAVILLKMTNFRVSHQLENHTMIREIIG